MITWSYGVTTVPKRIANGILQRTLESLSKGGFDNPRLFIDGLPNSELGEFSKLRITCHSEAIRIYGNFHLGISEMFIRNPHADRYAMFQDDFVTYPNLREYLEQCKYPDKGYLNLYTFPENLKKEKGWYLSNQLGKGAVALVFDNSALRALLNSPYWINRPAGSSKDPKRLWKFVDGGIVEALKQQGFKEYVHNPSLVQHTGTVSTLGNSRHALANSFKGEGYDLRVVTKSVVRQEPSRIGLVGYSTDTGLGELNRQLVEYANVYRWLVFPHPSMPMRPLPEDIDYTVCPQGLKIEKFLQEVDVVLFCERPFYNNLLPLCKKYGKRTVCIPMLEWTPQGNNDWLASVDRFICPTQQCYEELRSTLPCVYFPWPVDLKRYTFRQRTTCERFLFINGHGGWQGRKGGDVIRRVLELWPDMPLTIMSQKGEKWPSQVEVLSCVKENYQLYEHGDVLISPHSVDGIGLEGQEARACGMMVISTDGKPWNELPHVASISCTTEKRKVKRMVTWYLPDPVHLKETCKHWLDRDISQYSQEARNWAESMNWVKHKDHFNDLVTGNIS